jgi:hypothetical protein
MRSYRDVHSLSGGSSLIGITDVLFAVDALHTNAPRKYRKFALKSTFVDSVVCLISDKHGPSRLG